MNNFHTEAHKYIGVPFIHKGRTARGLDCVGLIILAARDCGMNVGNEPAHGRIWGENVLIAFERALHLDRPIVDKPRINDIALIRLGTQAEPNHVGIITTHPQGLGIIHAYTEVRKVVYHGLTEKIKERIVGVYRWAQ